MTVFTSASNCEWSILWSPSTRVSDVFHVYCFRKQLKGQCREIFNCWFFSWISFPQAPEYTIRAVSNFFEHSLRYLQHKVHHQCHWHQWQKEKIFNHKSFNYFVWTPLWSRVNL
jgi:hypothetical protein